MPIHRGYLERLVLLIDRIGGRFEPSDPFQRFRRRAFIVTLMILASVCLMQALIAFLMSHALFIVIIMSVLFGLVIASIIMTRRSPLVEPVASLVLSFLVVMGALLEVLGGHSPNTPLVYWSPVMLFGGYVFCGLQRGSLVAGFVMLSSLFIIIMPFVMNDARILPAGSAEAFQKRIFVTVLLCHFIPLAILSIYEKFFVLCHAEARALFDKMEGRKDRTFLGRLAQVLVGEMEPELRRMETAFQDLRLVADVERGTQEILKPLQELVQLTRRYEPLSIGALTAIDRGLDLQDLPDIMRRFTDFSRITLEGPTYEGFRFQGGQSFFLLIVLCLSLRELMDNPRVTLQHVTLSHQVNGIQIIMEVQGEEKDLRLSLAQDFLHDLDAKMHIMPEDEGTLSRLIGINVPLTRA
ncbi:MAG TPA: hypothetical protein VFO10_14690 [Oligoflexus sp.]|uniref:hypothetical protein n=1 Tax=Oligoflexus sp. TaxID=1971216 RepID=UPI002D7E220B|nr:hypothetical protein [Oligoflexus sp.]HET9238505.1 hypothetical protein [Oligoflexus sp.]